MKGPAPICAVCSHFHREGVGFRCAAFPLGIPDDIQENRFDHRHPHDGDHGIRFEPDPAMAGQVAAVLADAFAGQPASPAA